jgi:tetratricopeptide (TPR) repeat protein
MFACGAPGCRRYEQTLFTVSRPACRGGSCLVRLEFTPKMAQATNPKIDELRSRLNADPRSRLFYQLAEELRRASEFVEAEHVLRTGLEVYPAYLAAWVSLGRVLREQKKERDAIEALDKALQLDPSNVVAARLVADAWLELGEKAEALEKFRLIQALGHADEAVRNTIGRLQDELEGGTASRDPVTRESRSVPADPAPDSTAEAPPSELSEEALSPIALGGDLPPFFESSQDARGAVSSIEPAAITDEKGDVFESAEDAPSGEESPSGTVQGNVLVEDEERESDDRLEQVASDQASGLHERAFFESSDSPFADAERVTAEAARAFEEKADEETADQEPMYVAHDESPFEEPVSGYTAAALEVEAPAGIHIERSPSSAATDGPPMDDAEWLFGSGPAETDEEVSSFADPFLDDGADRAVPDLHAGDGVDEIDRAQSEPETGDQGAVPHSDRRVASLERWLSRVSRKDVPHV